MGEDFDGKWVPKEWYPNEPQQYGWYVACLWKWHRVFGIAHFQRGMKLINRWISLRWFKLDWKTHWKYDYL